MEVAVDTNVVVRYVTRDDPAQERQARAVFLANRVFVPMTVLLETEWVLRCTYRYAPEQIAEALTMIVENEGVRVENPDATRRALGAFRQGIDLADALHLASCAGLDRFVTFDRPLSRRAARAFPKIQVVTP